MFRFITLILAGLAANSLLAQAIEFSDCTEKTFCYPLNACGNYTVNFTMEATTSCPSQVIITHRIDFGNNGSPDVIGNSETVNTAFPPGVSAITWRGTTACGNVSTCTQLITVKDCQSPNLLCRNGLTQSLDPDCRVTFSAQQFILNVSDNCTATNLLQFGMRRVGTGTGFPTQDTVQYDKCNLGTNLIEVWVKDAAGNLNQCANYVIVQNNTGQSCPCITQSTIAGSGCARTSGNAKLQNYRVRSIVEKLNGTNPPTLLKTKTVSVQDSCFNMLQDNLPLGQNLRSRIQLVRTDNPTAGFTTYDLVLISKHILNVEPFTSFYQSVAADINSSQTVTTFDIVEGRKVLLGIYDTFPASPTWRFIKPVPFPDSIAAWNYYSDTYQNDFTGLAGDVALKNLNFVGIKTGDINYSATLNSEPDDRVDPLLLTATDRLMAAGDVLELPVYAPAGTTLSAWQVALQFNPELAEVESIDGLPEEAYVLRPDGSVRIAWLTTPGQEGSVVKAGQPLFTLRIAARQSTMLSEWMTIQTSDLPALAYNPDGVRRTMALGFERENHSIAQVQCFAPQPNPVLESVSWGIQSQQPAAARLDIFDLTGRLVLTLQKEITPGYQTIQVDRSALPESSGLLTWRLQAGDAVSGGKIFVR